VLLRGLNNRPTIHHFFRLHLHRQLPQSDLAGFLVSLLELVT
jgi:hypothetical protein